MSNVIYAKPKHSNDVKGRKDVGMDSDHKYVCWCYLVGTDISVPWAEVGMGRGETAEEARIDAHSRLVSRLNDPRR